MLPEDGFVRVSVRVSVRIASPICPVVRMSCSLAVALCLVRAGWLDGRPHEEYLMHINLGSWVRFFLFFKEARHYFIITCLIISAAVVLRK